MLDNNLKIHLDGARIFNAAVSQKSSLSDIASYFDSISYVCHVWVPSRLFSWGEMNLLKRLEGGERFWVEDETVGNLYKEFML